MRPPPDRPPAPVLDAPSAPIRAKAAPFYVGTAGWSVPQGLARHFADGASVLERYASRFKAVEINSSFYRPHQRKTYARWAASVPPDFRFAVKAPRQITHERRLIDVAALLDPFLDQIGVLGPKLGPVLFQLPPSLAFNDAVVAEFFAAWRERFDGSTVCEPRHLSWFSDTADRLLAGDRIARAAVDPALCAEAGMPGGFRGEAYFRLHGSPTLYESAYGADRLKALLRPLENAPSGQSAWCILDNTKFGAATEDALILADLDGFGGREWAPI